MSPGQVGGHKPNAIRGEHEVFLERRVREGGFGPNTGSHWRPYRNAENYTTIGDRIRLGRFLRHFRCDNQGRQNLRRNPVTN